MFLSGRIFSGYFYITQIALLIFAFGYSLYVSFEKFSESFIFVMRIIAIVSLIAFVFSNIIRNISSIPNISNSVFNTYKCLFLTNVPLSTSLARRNWGPFWEPGVYQYYLNIALVFTVFRKRNRWHLDVMLFIVTALTTLSGAAILPMPFILLANMFDRGSSRQFKRIIFAAITCFAVLIIFELGYFNEIIDKVAGIGEDNSSIGYRLGSALANIKATITYPLFGAAPEFQDGLRAQLIYKFTGRITSGNTNTFFGFYSYFGIAVGTYLSVRLFKFTNVITANKYARICLFIAIFLATSNENLMTSMLICILLFIKKSTKKNEDEMVNYESNTNRRNIQ